MGSLCGQGFAQLSYEQTPAAISSEAFLKELPPGSLPTEPSLPAFPLGTTRSSEKDPERATTQAAFSPKEQGLSSNSVITAQFESPEVTSTVSPTVSPTIGSGIAILPQQLFPTTLPSPQSQAIRWRDRWGIDPTLPNFCVGYETVSFRRGNDSVGPYSQGEGLNRFDQEVSGRYTFSRLLGKMDRIECKFTGPFHWDRQSTSMGPVNSSFPATIASSFDGADRHRQFHGVRLSSYELNRCWSGDELSMIYGGLRLFDHAERYRLESTKGASVSSFRLETDNFLAGGQMGMNLFRPISQRLTVGFASAMGLYGNFASGSLNAGDGVTTPVGASESGFHLNSMFEMSGRVNYRISQNIVAIGGYEWWYFPGLATPADQRLAYNSQLSQFSIRTGDDQLFRGWSVGLSARF
ncbi:MAG TPA: hypothetical protein VM260_10460 [Pirellula sp.]|nr:hypothetical protein [Pirellula sp.]